MHLGMKNKYNGTLISSFNEIGYEQVYGENYNISSISDPFTYYITIWVFVIILLVVDWYGELIDMKITFLMGKLD